MTTELVLLISLFAFILLGAFLGDNGPSATFKKAAPRLAAKIEADMSVGKQFKRRDSGDDTVTWSNPEGKGPK
jgi:hypothetical protein